MYHFWNDGAFGFILKSSVFQQIVSDYPYLCSSFVEDLVPSVECEVCTGLTHIPGEKLLSVINSIAPALGEGAGTQWIQREVTQPCYREVETKTRWG